jgi:hypothetical protein
MMKRLTFLLVAVFALASSSALAHGGRHAKDSDRDGLSNRQEKKFHFNAHKADTDGDGVKDADENAGTITSFDATTGALAITLASGDKISGKVTAATEIDCEAATPPAAAPTAKTARHDDEGDDDHGDDRGEDHGDDDEGDDDGADACGPADLTAGAIVHEAKIRVKGSGVVFKEIDLVK